MAELVPIVCLVAASFVAGCDAPPAAAPPKAATASSTTPSPIASTAGDGGRDDASSDATAGPVDAIDAAIDDASRIDASVDPVPSLAEADGAPLPQTDAFPSVDSPSYRARVALLWRAIVEDAPDVAAPAFFPLVAYEQVKAIPKPAADWKARLMAAFTRDLHAYHLKLAGRPAPLRFVALDVPVEKARWMKPSEEGNKLGYDRVLHSTLRFVDADGKDGTLDVASMISWRGEWYVVHLGGFE